MDRHELPQKNAAVVFDATTSTEALQGLFELAKAASSKVSLAYVCREAEIPSKGYLADVLKGRRLLNERYWEGVCRAFALRGATADALQLLCRRDQLRSDLATPAASAKARAAAERSLEKCETRLASLRKGLRKSQGVMPQKLRGMFFALEVFCAFGLFGGRPTRKDLKSYFGPGRGVELEYALHILATMGLVASDDDGRYRLLSESMRFRDSEDGISHLDFLELCLDDARAKVREWYGKPDAVFHGYLISVRGDAYAKAIPRLRDQLGVMAAELESSDADQLVRFNVQIYPVPRA